MRGNNDQKETVGGFKETRKEIMSSDIDLLLECDFNQIDNQSATECVANIKSRALKQSSQKSKMISGMKKEVLTDLLPTLPEPDEYYHIVSNGKFDYFTFLPVILDKVKHISEFYGSTWTMNRQNVTELIQFIDNCQIYKCTILSGTYFKRRETSVYATLLHGLTKRGMRYMACENHTKIMLMQSDHGHYVIEGSANWTANPRIEQNILANSESLYNFHREWMEEIFRGA